MSETKDYPTIEHDWQNHREVVQEIPFPKFWSRSLAEKYAAAPSYWETEQSETPLIELDLTDEGLGVVHIKNEGDQRVNPTGTMKDRMARACTEVYRQKAQFFLEAIEQDPEFEKRLATEHLLRFSIITAGNAGRALANAFETKSLPPPKLLLDKHTQPKSLEKLKSMRADLYMTDLSVNAFTGRPSTDSALSPEEILTLTNNSGGYDLTSANQDDNPERPWREFYFGLGGEVLRPKPDEIYDPYGSGATFEGLVDRQYLSVFEDEAMAKIKIFGAEPESFPSIADKLSAPAKPYVYYDEDKLNQLKQNDYTHPETGVYKVSEDEIKRAYEILKRRGGPVGIKTEPSASAGLALYIKRWENGLIKKDAKIIIINTGRGAFAE